jgi:hypothetical protein
VGVRKFNALRNGDQGYEGDAMKKLSNAQQDALIDLGRNESMSEAAAHVFVGNGYRRTMHALVREGLGRWYSSREHWKITADGRRRLDDLEAVAAQARVQTSRDAAIRKHRLGGGDPPVKSAKPVMKECDECGGTGEVEATCDECGDPLTEENVEPGTEDMCKECTRKSEAEYVAHGYAD